MNWDIALGNLAYAAMGIVLMFIGVWTFDKVTTRLDFPAEIAKGNMAMAVIIAAFLVSIAYIVGRSLN